MSHDVMDEFVYRQDPVRFAIERLGFQPEPKQQELLECRAKNVLLNCCRQWGKSTITAVAAVHRAVTQPGSLVLVASPSARQSGEFVRKAKPFVLQLGIKPRGDGDNDMSIQLRSEERRVGKECS